MVWYLSSKFFALARISLSHFSHATFFSSTSSSMHMQRNIIVSHSVKQCESAYGPHASSHPVSTFLRRDEVAIFMKEWGRSFSHVARKLANLSTAFVFFSQGAFW